MEKIVSRIGSIRVSIAMLDKLSIETKLSFFGFLGIVQTRKNAG